jgi:hypothetical protein
MIIDWEGASRGPAVADVALTWVIIGYSDIPNSGIEGVVTRAFQAAFTRSFIRAAGPVHESWRQAAIRERLTDPHLLPAEAIRLERLAAAG